MPYNPAGIFSLIASYFAEAGTTIRTEQHNPVFEDVASALSQAVLRDGRAPMTGALNMNGFPINNVATGNTPTSVATLAQGAPIGAMMDFAGPNAPSGWALCYGQAVSRTTYAALFALIGTTWGAGDGSTTFNLPDLRGRVSAGADAMGGAAANRLTSNFFVAGGWLGQAGGSQSFTQTNATMPVHNHGGTTGQMNANQTHSHGGPTVGRTAASFGSNFLAWASSNPSDSATFPGTQSAGLDHIHSVQWDGGGQPHPIIQPTAVVNKIIRVSYDV